MDLNVAVVGKRGSRSRPKPGSTGQPRSVARCALCGSTAEDLLPEGQLGPSARGKDGGKRAEIRLPAVRGQALGVFDGVGAVVR